MGKSCKTAHVPDVSSRTNSPSGTVVVLSVVDVDVPVLVIVTDTVVLWVAVVRDVVVSVCVKVVAVVVGVQFLNVNHSVCAGRQVEAGGATVMTRESRNSQYEPSWDPCSSKAMGSLSEQSAAVT